MFARCALLATLIGTLAGCSDSSPPAPQPDAAEPANVATGELGTWTRGPAVPTPRANHCIAARGNTVFVIGGNHKQGNDFVKTDEIHASTIATDGTLSAWQLVGHTPSPVSECTATASDDSLLVIDGLYDRDTDRRQVFAAVIASDGQLGPFAARATLPDIAISSEATIVRDQLIMMDTKLPAEGDATVTLRMPLAGGTWSSDDWGIGFRSQAQYAFAGDFAYTLGGYLGGDGNPVSADVFVTALASGAPATATSPLPEPVAFGEAVAVDRFVFVVGGRAQVFGGAPSTHVHVAPMSSDGTLGTWRTTQLPIARTNHELAVVGDYLVMAGGADTAGGDSQVWIARVRFAP